MKFLAILALAASFSAQASTCFTRTTDIMYSEVRLGSTICFEKPKLELNYFEDSYALLRYTVDGQPAFKRTALKGKFNAAGKYEVKVTIERSTEGGMCDHYYEASSYLALEIAKDGSSVNFKNVKGEVRYTYDQCHDQPDLMQSFDYLKL